MTLTVEQVMNVQRSDVVMVQFPVCGQRVSDFAAAPLTFRGGKSWGGPGRVVRVAVVGLCMFVNCSEMNREMDR